MESFTARPLRVGIVGAGIAGLALAGGLRRRGHDVEVFERAPRLMSVGAGISIAPNAVGALRRLGLAEAVLGDALARRDVAQGALLRPDGAVVLRVSGRRVNLLALTRPALHAALGAQAGPVRLGVDAAVSPSGEPIVVVDGREHAYDVVLAADGARSPARAALGLDPGLRYAGWTTWRGVTDEPFDLRGRVSETWGRGAVVGLVPLLGGHAYWFGAAHAPSNVTTADARKDALVRFGDWHAPIRAVIEATDARGVVRADAVELARGLTTYVRGRVALVGDAAHAMTPHLGQGANQAIVDAGALVRLLDAADPRGVAAALRSYDRRRRPVASAVTWGSLVVGRLSLAEGVGGRVRDGALAGVGTLTRLGRRA
ncbi:FAD-dependent monooxygenase [Xylanimonas ulmi]|uniref:2-polyprenyl-6-methoxyphenol hydroxylase-like FAD-dependent oxidoreductase n=1 Tax=Xylanimonas ulmi TaxID=228973 RepID=A0A4Q7M1C3_9MICO|nr:FAD-dependent monooxygenase [Xylanibacterium ulmi]RZS60178.1 2-polyprenyl-6-methoxyphenol hydroxylase-like FAD-dependent oxidoreductase [Xylanibacterium ulmi]